MFAFFIPSVSVWDNFPRKLFFRIVHCRCIEKYSARLTMSKRQAMALPDCRNVVARGSATCFYRVRCRS